MNSRWGVLVCCFKNHSITLMKQRKTLRKCFGSVKIRLILTVYHGLSIKLMETQDTSLTDKGSSFQENATKKSRVVRLASPRWWLSERQLVWCFLLPQHPLPSGQAVVTSQLIAQEGACAWRPLPSVDLRIIRPTPNAVKPRICLSVYVYQLWMDTLSRPNWSTCRNR